MAYCQLFLKYSLNQARKDRKELRYIFHNIQIALNQPIENQIHTL